MNHRASRLGNLALLAFGHTLAAQPVLPEIRSTSQLKAFVVTEDEKQPVRIQGCVTWAQPNEYGINLQSGDHGTMMVQKPPVPFKVGQCLAVQGVVRDAAFAPVIVPKNIQIVPPGSIPAASPRPQTVSGILEGNEISNLLTANGIVRDVRWNAALNVVELLLSDGAGLLPVHIWGIGPDPERLPRHLIDSRVQVTGVASGLVGSSSRKTIVGLRLKTRTMEDVRILQPAPRQPFEIPVNPMGSLFRYKDKQHTGHRAKFIGVVTAFEAGRRIVFSTGEVAMAAGVGPGEPLSTGDLIEVVGFPSPGQILPTVDFALYRKIGVGTPHSPLRLPAEAEAAKYAGHVVVADVRYTGSYRHLGNRMLRVRFGDTPLLVQLPESVNIDLQPDCVLRVTGVYWVDGTSTGSTLQQASLLTRSVEDIQVIEASPFFTQSRLWWFAGAVAGLGWIASAWVFLLRRRVAQQTEQIRLRLESEASLEVRYRDLFENSNDAIYTHNYKLRFTSWNRAAERITGYTREEMVGRHCSSILAPDQFEFARELRDKILGEGDIPPVYQIAILAKDGRRIHLEAASRRIETPDGPQIECISRDITRRIEHARQLEEARERAESATRAKSGFLANMSHEIRTPVNGILGMNQLLLESSLSSEQKEWCEAIQLSGTLLVSIVNDILDVTKIESGRMQIDRHPFDLQQVLSEAHRLLLPKATAQPLAFVLNYPDSAPRRFFGDPLRIRQIMLNFLNNAIKFTPCGAVRMDAVFQPNPGDSVTVRISVTDTGIGIEPAVQERLFQRFVQADSSTTRQYGGTGLGLAISKDLAGLMHGNVGCESAPGEGSTFWVELPLDLDLTPAIAAASHCQQQTVCSFGRGRLLLVEDNRVNQKLMQRMLESRNFKVVVAENGEEAVARYQEQAFEAVLMDCQMPVLDGYQATAAIRALEAGTRRTPIIALTANAMSGDREQCLASGMDDYLSKPVHREELDNTLARWLEARTLLTPHS